MDGEIHEIRLKQLVGWLSVKDCLFEINLRFPVASKVSDGAGSLPS
jgi:hypothetical protein